MRSLGSAQVVVHAPALFGKQLLHAGGERLTPEVEALVRRTLWPMVREQGAPILLNRMRLGANAPVVPHRIAICPIRKDDALVGVVAALRGKDAPAFAESDLDLLGIGMIRLADEVSRSGPAQSALLRRPAFELEVAARAKGEASACVVYADLDQLHVINEISGFEAGDELIREVSQLLQQSLLPAGSVATHLSGGRYAAALFGHSLGQAREWAEQVRLAIGQRTGGGRVAQVTASFGVASLIGSESFQDALAAAETACRVAKERGRNRIETYAAGELTVIRRHEEVWESRLIIDAIEADRCVLYAQPIVELEAPEHPAHYEILVRIRDAQDRLVSLSAYLKAAERYQVLERLDRWVVSHALALLAPRADELLRRGLRFAINITGQSLSQPEFADFVLAGLRRHGVPGSLLAFEFTETAAVRNLAVTRAFIASMAGEGIRIALDDFGTGHSSLMHLKELAVNQIKIDATFIRDVLTDARSAALVQGLARIATQLGLETVAEFVETREVANHLRSLGVRYAQGYLYGRPRPLCECLADCPVHDPAEPERARG